MPRNNISKTRSILARLRAEVPTRRLEAHELTYVIERQATLLRRVLDVDTDAFPVEDIADIPRIKLTGVASLPTSACAFWNGHNWQILVNTSEAPTRQRFSVLHELHHIISHSHQQHLFGDGDADSLSSERFADLFAANVLMPRMLVKRHWGEGPRDSSTLAHRFGVSRQAMNYRLQKLGLTEPAPRCPWPSSTTAQRPQLEVAA